MKAEELPAFTSWKSTHPREAYALDQLPEKSDLRDELVTAVLKGPLSGLARLKMARLADAVDYYDTSKSKGIFEEPFRWGIRRPIQIRILSTTQVRIDRKVGFRVDVQTFQGWSGYFETRSPTVLGQIKQNSEAEFTLIGEVEKRLTRFYVIFGGQLSLSR